MYSNGNEDEPEAEPAPRGSVPVVQELDVLFQLGTLPSELRTINNSSPRPIPSGRTVSYQQREWQHRPIPFPPEKNTTMVIPGVWKYRTAIQRQCMAICFSPMTKNPYWQRCWLFRHGSAIHRQSQKGGPTEAQN